MKETALTDSKKYRGLCPLTQNYHREKPEKTWRNIDIWGGYDIIKSGKWTIF
jgi:hypothetical protein